MSLFGQTVSMCDNTVIVSCKCKCTHIIVMPFLGWANWSEDGSFVGRHDHQMMTSDENLHAPLPPCLNVEFVWTVRDGPNKTNIHT